MSRVRVHKLAAILIATALTAVMLTLSQVVLTAAPASAQTPGCALTLTGCNDTPKVPQAPPSNPWVIGKGACTIGMTQPGCESACQFASTCVKTNPPPSASTDKWVIGKGACRANMTQAGCEEACKLSATCVLKNPASTPSQYCQTLRGVRTCENSTKLCPKKSGSLFVPVTECTDREKKCTYTIPPTGTGIHGGKFECTYNDGRGAWGSGDVFHNDNIPADQWKKAPVADIPKEFNTENLQQLSNWLMYLALLACTIGIFVSAALWALGSKGQNPGQELTGKKGLILCCTAAFFIGALPGMLNWLNATAHRADTGTGGTRVTGASSGDLIKSYGGADPADVIRVGGGKGCKDVKVKGGTQLCN